VSKRRKKKMKKRRKTRAEIWMSTRTTRERAMAKA
jgi:hypothetical protein